MPASAGSALSQDAIWNQIDHELGQHKFSLISNEMQRKVTSEKRRVLSEAHKTGNRGAAIPRLIEMHRQLTDEWVIQPRRIVIRFSRLRRLRKIADQLSRSTQERGAEPTHLLEHLETTVRAIREGCDLDGNLLPVTPGLRARRAELLTLATVEAKPVAWLWETAEKC